MMAREGIDTYSRLLEYDTIEFTGVFETLVQMLERERAEVERVRRDDGSS